MARGRMILTKGGLIRGKKKSTAELRDVNKFLFQPLNSQNLLLKKGTLCPPYHQLAEVHTEEEREKEAKRQIHDGGTICSLWSIHYVSFIHKR